MLVQAVVQQVLLTLQTAVTVFRFSHPGVDRATQQEPEEWQLPHPVDSTAETHLSDQAGGEYHEKPEMVGN